jgi:hypothetical protein
VSAPQLLIVRRGHFAIYELLTRTFADDSNVQIVWDRRVGERHQTTDAPGDEERRRTDRRRQPPTQWGQLNYMIAGNEGSGSASPQ